MGIALITESKGNKVSREEQLNVGIAKKRYLDRFFENSKTLLSLCGFLATRSVLSSWSLLGRF